MSRRRASALRALALAALTSLPALSCKEEQAEGASPAAADPDPPDALPIPDISGMDLEAAFQDALELAVSVHTGVPWDGLGQSLSLAQASCPDLYAGNPDPDALDDVEGGAAWKDACTTAGGLTWDGFGWWKATISSTGDVLTPEGQTFEGQRELIGDGSVGDSSGPLYGFRGEATDALSLVSSTSPFYKSWSWSSTVNGTTTGTTLFAPSSRTPQGWRADLYLSTQGGSAETLSIRGDAYFFEPVIEGNFDSLSAELDWASPESSGPTDCSLEPRGILSIRDPSAIWYDLVFLPLEDSSAGDTGANAACDGCGTLFVRGVEVTELCVDLSFVWNGTLDEPELEGWAFDVRSPEPEPEAG